MKNNNPHMLDTNILLGMILPNDNSYKSAEKYLKTTYLRYISETSCKEAENKILNIQKLSLDISEFLKIYSINNNINYLNIPKIKSQVKKRIYK